MLWKNFRSIAINIISQNELLPYKTNLFTSYKYRIERYVLGVSKCTASISLNLLINLFPVNMILRLHGIEVLNAINSTCNREMERKKVMNAIQHMNQFALLLQIQWLFFPWYNFPSSYVEQTKTTHSQQGHLLNRILQLMPRGIFIELVTPSLYQHCSVSFIHPFVFFEEMPGTLIHRRNIVSFIA